MIKPSFQKGVNANKFSKGLGGDRFYM